MAALLVLGLQFIIALAAVGAVMLPVGCTTLGSIESRAKNINTTTASYASSAILLNILRARFAEPLNFVSLTGVTGHDTANLSIGLPTIIIGPGRNAAEHLFLFGPNSVGGSQSDDFNVSVINDPQSFAALLRPVDPATLGFFINQFYNRGQLFFLFISRIQLLDENGSVIRDANGYPQDYYNEPYYLDEFSGKFVLNSDFSGGFYPLLYSLIDDGLTVAVDQTFVPRPGEYGTARLCFDEKFAAPGSLAHAPGRDRNTSCRLAVSAAASPSWTFEDLHGRLVHVFTRSVFGAYRYLGELLALREEGLWKSFGDRARGVFLSSDTTEILHITHDVTGCWASVAFNGSQWCVPETAIGTKRTFALLHQLFELYASPNNAPVTPTVRVTQ